MAVASHLSHPDMLAIVELLLGREDADQVRAYGGVLFFGVGFQNADGVLDTRYDLCAISSEFGDDEGSSDRRKDMTGALSLLISAAYIGRAAGISGATAPGLSQSMDSLKEMVMAMHEAAKEETR